MQYNDYKYTAYIKILEEELVPAMGCTEPIAIAYCAAIIILILTHKNILLKDIYHQDIFYHPLLYI